MMAQPPSLPAEEVPTSPMPETESGEVTVRLSKRVPRRRADGSVAPRRRLTRTSGGETVREVTAELPLAEALAEPTVRVLAPHRSAADEQTLSGRELTWPGRTPPPAPPTLGPAPFATDELPSPPRPPDEVLEVGEPTTGSLHLGAGLHAPATPAAVPASAVAAESPTVPEEPSIPPEDDRTLPDPTPPATTGPTPEFRPPPRPARTSYTTLVASAGGFVGLLVGVVFLVLILLVVWLSR
jgi:hypothetical protein